MSWRCSHVSTVLFNSRLSEPWNNRHEDRVFGRTDLAFHELHAGGSVQSFSGRGTFGDRHGSTTDSVWGNKTLAEDLHLTRSTDETGTSLLIVGFHDPSNLEATAQHLVEALAAAWKKWYWPLLQRGGVNVRIEHSRGRIVESSNSLVCDGAVAPLVDAMDRYARGNVVDQLKDPGDVIVRDVSLNLPGRRDGGHGPLEHKAKLVIRLAGEDDDPTLQFQVAMFRKPQMVVSYMEISPPQTGGIPFHAFLVCGEGVGDLSADHAAEEFLQKAEPPAHDRWEYTDDVATVYKQGGWVALRDFRAGILAGIRLALNKTTPDVDKGPDCLRRLLRIGGGSERTSCPIADLRGAPIADCWHIEADIKVDNRDDGWSFKPVLEYLAESGANEVVGWKTLEAVSGCEVDPLTHAVVITKSGRSKAVTVKIRGVTEDSNSLIPPDRAAVTMSFRDISVAKTKAVAA